MAAGMVVVAAGCAAPDRAGRPHSLADTGAAPRATSSEPTPAHHRAADSRAGQAVPGSPDPMQMIHQALERTEALDGYEIVFHRRERLGLFDQLGDWQTMRVQFREQPHAIKVIWLDKDSEYLEAVYVAGRDDGKLTVLPRKGILGLPATPAKVEPQAAVQWGKSLRPITDFGLENTIRETIAHIREAEEYGGATVRYEGRTEVPRTGLPAHQVAIEYPRGFVRAARQELYIDVETGLPVGVTLWLPNGDLLGSYLYERPKHGMPPLESFVLTNSRTAATQ